MRPPAARAQREARWHRPCNRLVRGPRRADFEEAAMRWVGVVALCAVGCGGAEDGAGEGADETIEAGGPHAAPFARGESAVAAASPQLRYLRRHAQGKGR